MNKNKAAGKTPDILDRLETQISATDRITRKKAA